MQWFWIGIVVICSEGCGVCYFIESCSGGLRWIVLVREEEVDFF